MKKIILVILIFALAACSSKKEEKENKQNDNKESTVKELLKLDDNQMLVATLKTNMGTIEIELFAKQTPKTVENFVGLAKKDYYKDVTFHRVIPEFMIQGGDPTGTGSGGESFWGKDFEDEIVSDLKHDKPGILSMANRGPNTNSSQFFITLVPTPWLDGKHTVFGKVIKGMETVEAIGNVATKPPYDKPVKDVVIQEVIIEKTDKN